MCDDCQILFEYQHKAQDYFFIQDNLVNYRYRTYWYCHTLLICDGYHIIKQSKIYLIKQNITIFRSNAVIHD